MRFSLALFPILAAVHVSAAEIPVRGLAWPALSPDGRTLAFEWLNDIWLAPSAGGEAVRVTETP